jgi:hypothetical protein
VGAERRAVVAGALVAWAALAMPAVASAQTGPAAEGARRWRGPHRGLLVQGRLGQSFGGASLGGLVGLGAVGTLGSSSALGAALGYRGGSWSLAFAPSLSSSSSGSEGSSASTYLQLGLGVLVDRVIARAADDRVELGLLAGASLSFVSYEASARSDDGVAFGLLLGLSTRYWLSPAVAVGVEIGESYTSAPVLSLGTAADADARTSAFATFGTINLSVVFGG